MTRNDTEEQNQGLPDEALLASTRTGDEAAFGELWKRHANAGAAAARQFSSIADVDDLVSEAYLRIFRVLQNGGGPRDAFRPYLYSTIRNIALDWRQKLPVVSLEVAPELEDPAGDPETTVIERSVTARAFHTLPERWQAVLWYLEVEGMEPAETAPLLGLSPNATSALAVRAREGLRKAWLQAHVSEASVPAGCRWTTNRMGDYARGSLSRRGRERFERHLETCERCSQLLDEVDDLGGRLAGLLLPLSLGGTAGVGLLAQLSAHRAQPVGQGVASVRVARPTVARTAVLVGAGILALATLATGAWASSTGWLGLADAPMAADPADAPPTSTPYGSPSPTPTSTMTPTETAPPNTGPPAPPRKPTDLSAPAAPQLRTPIDGALTNTSLPLFSGTGEPGAWVVVNLVDPLTFELVLLGRATVGAGADWSFMPTAPLPDGTHVIQVSQTDAAGNRSEAVTSSLTIDTVALAPVLDPSSPSPQLYLPAVTGSGETGASVTLRDEAGAVLGTALVGSGGRWSIPLPDPYRDDQTLAATQTDPAGNTSIASDATTPMSFDRPTIPSPASGSVIASTGGETIVQIELAGHEGMQVQVLIDGVGTGNTHTLEADPIPRVTPPLPDGVHTIGVRYIDTTTGAVGSIASISFEIAP